MADTNGAADGATTPPGGDDHRRQARERAAALRAEQKRAARRRSILLQGGVVAAVVVIVLGVTVAVMTQGGDDAPTAGSSSSSSYPSTPAGFGADGGLAVGSDSAPVTLTLVEDFACPHCQAFEAANKSLFDSYAAGDDVTVEYRPIAFLDQMSTDDYSSRALNAAACVVAEDEGNWPAMHTALFDEQPAEGGAGLTDDQLIDLAVDAGADEGTVGPCITDRAYDSWVASTTAGTTGESWFSGTPTVLVDGTVVDDVSAAGIEQAVEAARGE